MTDSTDFTGSYVRTSKAFRSVTAAAMHALGLHPGQHLLLICLADEDGQTPGEIAAAIRVSGPTVVKMTSRMESAGLVLRRRDEHDHRLARVYLTPAGRELIVPVRAKLAEIEARLTAGFSAAERRSLVSFLQRVEVNADALQREWNAAPVE
jgi:MarR family transcriptional regulator, organic hydroperoxide resistance regulator